MLRVPRNIHHVARTDAVLRAVNHHDAAARDHVVDLGLRVSVQREVRGRLCVQGRAARDADCQRVCGG